MREAEYILSTQHSESGALNDVFPDKSWTWIVPRENALGLIALETASKRLSVSKYHEAALAVAEFLVTIQDTEDGGWRNKFEISKGKNSSSIPFICTDRAKSPTHTAEIMMAFGELGFDKKFYGAMISGADFLLGCTDVSNKKGLDDGLLCGGKDQSGEYSGRRWTQDNAFGWHAFKTAAEWCRRNKDDKRSKIYNNAANRIVEGLQKYLLNSETGAWHRSIDTDGVPESTVADWGCYAPAMLDLPVDFDARLADWIHNTFQLENGAVREVCILDNGLHSKVDSNYRKRERRLSPGFSFMAARAWQVLERDDYATAAIDWADNCGLWCSNCNPPGGWVDWIDTSGHTSSRWQRFIDTSYYSIMARLDK